MYCCNSKQFLQQARFMPGEEDAFLPKPSKDNRLWFFGGQNKVYTWREYRQISMPYFWPYTLLLGCRTWWCQVSITPYRHGSLMLQTDKYLKRINLSLHCRYVQAPLAYPRERKRRMNGGEDWLPFCIYDKGFTDRLSPSYWSDYYSKIKRDPENTDLAPWVSRFYAR